jgi:PAS domain S-box-containing protein
VAGVVLVFRDQTQEHRQQQALRDSEEKYRGLVEQSLAGIFIIQDGRFAYGSQRLAEIFGYASPEALAGGSTILERVAPEHRQRLSARIASRFAGEPGREWLEFTGLRRDGQRIELEGHSRLVVHQGRPALIGLMLDVTESRRAQEEARSSEVRYRQLFDNSPLPKWIYHPETLRFLEVNQAALTQYGYTREEFLRMTLEDIRPAGEWAALRADVASAREVEPPHGTWRHRKKDGTLIEVEISGQAFVFGGEPCRLVAAHDVTVRQQAAEALRASEEKFRQLAETIHEVFWITDVPKQRILYASPGYQKIWGRPVESLLADPMSWAESIHPEDRERVVLAAQTKQVDGTYDEVYRIRRPDGAERWIRDRAFPVKGDGLAAPERVVGIAEDITELRQTEAQLRQSQKMEAFGQLAGGVAHDFNNLLIVMLSASDELADTLGPGDPRRETLDAISGAAQRAAALTRQLLVFSRREVTAPRVLDLNEVVSGVTKMLRRLLGEDLEFKCDLAPDLRPVRADAGHLEQLLMNLAVNARDAMPGGGKLTLATANAVLDEADARALPGARPGAFVQLSVTDTGCGMTPEVQARIFEPFFTTKEVGRGTGLGLATVFGIVARSEGFIDVRSAPGEGSRLTVYLPAAQRGQEAPSVQRPGGQREGGTERVLLVEDDVSVRRIAVRALTARGYQVVQAANGVLGLAAALEAGPIDLLITDVVMPAMSGPALAGKLQATRPGLKVLFMSGYVEDAMASHGLSTGGVPFLQKPFTASSLVAKVRAVLDGSG